MNKKKKQQNIDMKAPDVIETPASRETPESEREFQIEDELLAVADVPEELIEDIDAEEGISIKEGERIGLGLRSMQTQADIEKRKKKRKKKIVITILVLLLIVACGTLYYIKVNQETETTVESSEDAVAGENQQIILGEITEIKGNEIKFDLVEEEVSESSTETDSEKGKPDMSTGEMPSMNGSETSAINGGGMPDDSSTEAGTNEADMAAVKAAREATQKTYRSLGEEREMTIPVGTDVVTKLGTTTTFARLAAGDVVQLLIENNGTEEVIVKMWIIG